MHVNDITKLKDFGNYDIDVPMKSIGHNIEIWQRDDGLQLNPDFQRGHVWSEAQRIAFLEFILRGGVCPPLLFNHPGWMSSFEGEFVCVDGLQRITSIMMFLNNELPVFGGHYRKDIEGIDGLMRGIYLSVYVNNLKTKREVLEWYLELNGGGTPHTKAELDRVREMLKKED